ncbi:hypothetical protein [Lysobacter sp. 1R34A]|uniref:hypothetical protein n=1 Tax=Lysobacter sp. 1R34A TaxID=3445786 RepID=UPI003EEC5024
MGHVIALYAAFLVAGVGLLVLVVELPGVFRELTGQRGREIAYLAQWSMHDAGDTLIRDASRNNVPDDQVDDPDVDYTHDLPFVNFTGTIDEFKAAEIARMDDALRLHSMVGPDGYLDLQNASPCDLAWFYGHDDLSPQA